MRNNLALSIALAALGLSLWSGFARRHPDEPRPATSGERLTPLPQLDSLQPLPCGETDGVTSLKALMRARINPTMTQLSFALYHDQGPARLQRAADSAGRLLGCIHLAPSLPPVDISLGGLPDYFRFLGNLQENALGVQIAAMEQDLDGARHWFRHLKQDCAACHSRFRVELTPP